jgi:uncharacterized metal-binding protein YceD (DUF177 family)
MDYTIPINDLKEGKHRFEFDVADKFFEPYPESEVQKCSIHVVVDLTKRSTGVDADFSLAGKATVVCDRCLDEFEMPLEYNSHISFQLGDEPEEVSDELVVISRNNTHLDLRQYIYEFINLAVPCQKYHPEDENGNSACDPEMIERLNNIRATKSDGQETDPRWNKLKDLIN